MAARQEIAGTADAAVTGLAPVCAEGARILVLGSMPGVASLRAQRYYAHPRNAFWPMAARILGFDPGLSYEARMAALAARGVALWDVLAACDRKGSLDSAIDRATLVPNDFATFYARHPGILRVCFNGAAAADLYARHVLPRLASRHRAIECVRLPSTSPANAAIPYADKLRAWQEALAP